MDTFIAVDSHRIGDMGDSAVGDLTKHPAPHVASLAEGRNIVWFHFGLPLSV
jgi:hypothetical protein